MSDSLIARTPTPRARAAVLLMAQAARRRALVEDPSRPPPPSLFVKLWRLLRDAGQAGAEAAAVAEKGAICNYAGTCVISFDKTNPRAIHLARHQARNLIVEISTSSRSNIARMIAQGLQTGIAPKPMSRILRKMVTLNSEQQKYALNLAEELRTAQAGDLITRFPPRPGVRKIPGFRARVPAGGPNQRWVTQNLSRYQRMQHFLRARTIARSEAHYAANGGQKELWNQAVDKGQLPPDVKRVWITAGDERVRDAHGELEGETAGLEADFPTGIEPGEEANCRCGQAIAPREGVGVPSEPTAPSDSPWPLADDDLRKLDDEFVWAMEPKAGEWANGLQPDQRRDLLSYTAGGHGEINRSLRGESLLEGVGIDASTAKKIKGLDAALKSAPSVGDRVVWRQGFMPADLKAGEQFHLMGYQSATVKPSTLADFHRPGNIVMEIRTKGRGAFLGHTSASTYPTELEVLMPRDSKYVFRGWKNVKAEIPQFNPAVGGEVPTIIEYKVAQIEIIG